MTSTLHYLSRNDVEKVALPMKDIIEALEGAFAEKAEGRTEMPPKPGIHPRKDAFIHAMPAYVPKAHAAGIKWVGGFPSNLDVGLPYITGILVLNDPETGFPIAVMDCTWITAKRTGAVSALGAKYLARPDSSVMGVCGCGVQGMSHTEAFATVLPNIKEVLAYDISREAQERYVATMGAMFPDIRFTIVDSPETAIREADAVVTAGPILKVPNPTIHPGWLRKGGFASAVDFDCYWTPEALDEFDILITDDIDQTNYYKSIGYLGHLKDVTGDLASVVAGKQPGRENDGQRTMCMFLGLAIEDMVTARLILDRAKEMNIGTELPL